MYVIHTDGNVFLGAMLVHSIQVLVIIISMVDMQCRVGNYNCSDNPTGGSCNIAFGFNAFGQRAGGHNNVILGRYAGYSNSTGLNNFASNNGAMCNVSGSA